VHQHLFVSSKKATQSSSTALRAAAVAAAEGATVNLASTSHEDRVIGALLGSMCGNALGVQVEPEKHFRLTRLFPNGLQSFWGFDYNTSKTPVPSGSVTGDFITMLAVAQSLVDNKQLDFFPLLDALADAYISYPAEVRRYSPYSCMVAQALVQGADPFSMAEKAEAMLNISTARTGQAASAREERQLYGTSDASAILRAVPVAVAYAGGCVLQGTGSVW
jgi:ADP-ribosylglycohydrolase